MMPLSQDRHKCCCLPQNIRRNRLPGFNVALSPRSAINKYSLNLVSSDAKLFLSTLGEKTGIIGNCLIARNKLLNLAP